MAPSPDAPEPAPASVRAAVQQPSGAGVALVLGCYTLWGVFPLYFRLLADAGSVEIIGHRIVWTLVTCLGLVTVRRQWGRLRRILRSARLLGALTVSGLLVSVNWLIYVYGINTGRTADAALGYFINPLVTVALAALVLRERLRPVHRLSIGLATAAVALLVVLQGSLPWVSLTLALSFGLYGLVKKRIGPQVDALTGLTVESAVVCPAAVAYLGRLAWRPAPRGRTGHGGAAAAVRRRDAAGTAERGGDEPVHRPDHPVHPGVGGLPRGHPAGPLGGHGAGVGGRGHLRGRRRAPDGPPPSHPGSCPGRVPDVSTRARPHKGTKRL